MTGQGRKCKESNEDLVILLVALSFVLFAVTDGI